MKQPVKILYIQPYNWECGPHQSLRALIAHLDREQFAPVIVLPHDSSVAREFAELGAEIHYEPGIGTIPRSLSPRHQSSYWRQTLLTARRLEKVISERDVSLVHSNSEASWAGALAARKTEIPAISHLRGLSILTPSWVGRLTTRSLNRLNDALVATSDSVKRSYIACGANQELIQTIYNGLNTKLFAPERASPSLRAELGLTERHPLIGMIAHLEPRKGHHDFIAACAIIRQAIPQARFVVVGDTNLYGNSDYYLQLQQAVEQHQLTEAVYFLGLRRDIPNILASLDIVVQPSLTEAGPRVPIEAMAMQRPIVVSDVGGNSEEVLDGKTGLVVPAGNVEALTQAVLRLLDNNFLARKMGAAGRQRVLSLFTEESCALQVQQLYRRLLAGMN